MRIGVICPSEIAIRRFMPALMKCPGFQFAGIGVFSKCERFGSEEVDDNIFKEIRNRELEKARVFLSDYGGKLYESYEAIATAEDIDALYIPLPPALHFKWAKLALLNGKHVLIEKPATISADECNELIQIATKNNLAIHENYMFVFHNQITAIDDIVKNGEIGDVRLYRICFGFPKRMLNDFRYNKNLGGGALYDAGGYTIRYAVRLLGNTAKLKYAQSNYINGFDVDMYGSAALVNSDGITAQVAFGMDNDYKCELEIWGSNGCIKTGRILTAPVGFTPQVIISKGNDSCVVDLPSDDTFYKSILHFENCIINHQIRNDQFEIIKRQAELIDEFKEYTHIL